MHTEAWIEGGFAVLRLRKEQHFAAGTNCIHGSLDQRVDSQLQQARHPRRAPR
jgi:hypothetical protein